MIEDLLADLSDSGWTISWAFQYAPAEWRVTIIRLCDWNGYDQPDHYIAHCAFAPTFAEALEDAMCKRNDAELVEGSKLNHSVEPTDTRSLLARLNLLRPTPPLTRRL